MHAAFRLATPLASGRRLPPNAYPTLAEALELVRDRARVMIEIKPDAVGAHVDDGIEEQTLRIVRECGVAENVAILSFDRRALERCLRLGTRHRSRPALLPSHPGGDRHRVQGHWVQGRHAREGHAVRRGGGSYSQAGSSWECGWWTTRRASRPPPSLALRYRV